jgi:hypothetical protein
MIVGEAGSSVGPGEIVRLRTVLATVRDGRYSPNMCSPTTIFAGSNTADAQAPRRAAD